MDKTQTEPVEIEWDVDEGTVRIGSHLDTCEAVFEMETRDKVPVTRLVNYLRHIGVEVRYTEIG